jgi:hypothetical protein
LSSFSLIFYFPRGIERGHNHFQFGERCKVLGKIQNKTFLGLRLAESVRETFLISAAVLAICQKQHESFGRISLFEPQRKKCNM